MTKTTIFVIAIGKELQFGRCCNIGKIDQTYIVDIELNGALIERYGKMVPLAFLQQRGYTIHISTTYIIIIGFLESPLQPSAKIPRAESKLDMSYRTIIGHKEFWHNYRLPVFFTLADKHVPFKGENIRQIRVHILHHGLHSVVTCIKVQILLAIHHGCFSITVHWIPLRRELTHLLASKVVLEKHTITTFEVALLTLSHSSWSIIYRRCSRSIVRNLALSS